MEVLEEISLRIGEMIAQHLDIYSISLKEQC